MLGYDLVHVIAGDDRPLPTSTSKFALSNSASFPILSHNRFCALTGDISSLCQYPKFNISPPVANCITGDNVL
jgi:hypothetical protein